VGTLTDDDRDNIEAWKQAVKLRDYWARVEAGEENAKDEQRLMAATILAAIELFHDRGLDKELLA
jgi:hypothetical protein